MDRRKTINGHTISMLMFWLPLYWPLKWSESAIKQFWHREDLIPNSSDAGYTYHNIVSSLEGWHQNFNKS
ncbi:hypothetical protein QUF70_08200 [Desulfobacterales bacterium HSG17]|nr:hypothetical protein [Desulfobacterales bacterium HSG17]